MRLPSNINSLGKATVKGLKNINLKGKEALDKLLGKTSKPISQKQVKSQIKANNKNQESTTSKASDSSIVKPPSQFRYCSGNSNEATKKNRMISMWKEKLQKYQTDSSIGGEVKERGVRLCVNEMIAHEKDNEIGETATEFLKKFNDAFSE